MRQPQRRRLLKKVVLVGLLLAGYVVADGGETIGACPYIWSCSQCEGVYEETLNNCRSGCSYGDYDCWYTQCEAAAAYNRDQCYNCCT
jgi:hypothetical protein